MHALVILGLAVLAGAVPHGHSHQHYKKHDKTLAGRDTIDWNLGTCGGSTGFTCGAGYCCSQWNFCGKGDGYCGAGCQFGACNGKPSKTALANCTTTAGILGTPSAYTVPASLSSIAWPSVATPAYSSPSQAPSYAAPKAPAYSAPKAPAYAAPSVYSAPTTTAASSTSYNAPAATSSSAPTDPSSGGGIGAGLGNIYKMYIGTGEQAAGWPVKSAWSTFDDAWNSNLDILASSCSQWGVDNNSDQENDDLKSAIQSVAVSSGVDERFILAIVMQESNGCVRAPTTTYSVSNPGLMQSYMGTATCNPGTSTSPQGQSPCPASTIKQMINQGTNGIKPGDMSLVYALQKAGCDDVSKYYKAARIYNSGSIAPGGNLGAGVATHCYASNVANRLTGWTTATCGCNLG